MPKEYDLICDLIEVYRNNPCLWKKKDLDFKNKFKKDAALEECLHMYKTYDPNATIELVKRKLNTLKKGFQTEYTKVQKSGISGSGVGDVYVPKLWYYELMLFLRASPEASHFSSIAYEETIDDTEEYLDEVSKY